MAMTAMLLGDFETEHFADPTSVVFFVVFNIMGARPSTLAPTTVCSLVFGRVIARLGAV